MTPIIEYKSLLAYSEKIEKGFFTEFSSGTNIIYGRNTSGKSTLIQGLHYVFGINDEKHKLYEVLNEDVIFRLDFVIKKTFKESVTIIRDDDSIYIQRQGKPIKKFTGISGNNSKEHIKLKKYLSDLFGFKLKLESSNEYKEASLEAMFLPYYVAQDYGWVLPLKSFRGLDFYRNFKSDYFDYYLGVTNEFDRLKKQQLEKKKNDLTNSLNFLLETEKSSDELKLSKLKDEAFVIKTSNYLVKYRTNKDSLISFEKEYLINCNKLTFWEERLKILKRVRTSLKKQNPIDNDCPTCHQPLLSTQERVYNYFQDVNDTDNQIETLKKKLTELKGTINSLETKITELKKVVAEDYSILQRYDIKDLTFSTWLENKANVQLTNNIHKKIGLLTLEIRETTEELNKYKTEDDLKKERNNKDFLFKKTFEKYLEELNVKSFEDGRYTLLYKMKLFPRQGVELLKTLLAYYFAFNKTIKETSYVHRLPLIMDAIFKEDIDDNNKELILKFIAENSPKDTQTIFSVAQSKKSLKKVKEYNKLFFDNNAEMILINTKEKRSFLSDIKSEYEELIQKTLEKIQ